ncbi:MAG: hypothetical protein GY817_08450 [bacterium]|nr:hypothetical protein [bacterium]
MKQNISKNLDFTSLNNICARAIDKAKENNRKNGVPNAFVKNGKIYFEMPDGKITDKDPFKK